MGDKPVIAVPCFEDENSYIGLPMFVKEMAEPHFTLIKESEVTEKPENWNKIQGLMSHPGWSFFTPTVMDKMENLKVLSTVSAGYNHLDLNYLQQRNVRVGYTPKVLNDCVADLAMLLILTTSRKIKPNIEKAYNKELTAFGNSSACFGNDVTGKTLGIVGMGGIGFEVAKRSKGFRMKVLYHNRSRRSDESEVRAEFYPSLHEMLPVCDFVLISCALSQSTKHLFSTKEFKAMKKTSTIINVARGAVIDHKALTEALQSNEIKAAGLDVTDPEPLTRDDPLLKLENVTILPHIGSQTMETRGMMWQRGIDNLKAVLIDNAPMPSELKM